MKADLVLKALGITPDKDAHKVFWAKDFENYKEVVALILGEQKVSAPKVEAKPVVKPKKKGK